jgi:Flp pilus assembly protein TadD
LNKNGQPEGQNEAFFKLVPKGEDWLGFKDLMQKSQIEDKDLILRILEMYSDLDKREQEIKNLAATYVEVADQILPQLRRSSMTLNYDKVGKSDEEISQLAKSNPAELTLEELLYAASLTQDIGAQLAIYQAAESRFPEDWRAVNNAGYCMMMQNKLRDGQKQFEKASKIKDQAVITNNLGVCFRLNGDREKAEEMFTKALSAGSEVSYNMGIVNIQNGNYEAAVGNMASAESFNNALAKLLARDFEGALRIMDTAPEKDTAMGYYLKAIIGSRMNNLGLIKENLEAAIAADASLKAKANRDAEFVKYKDSLGSILN